jgi:hypothetical protein
MIPLQREDTLTWTDDDGVIFIIAPAIGQDEFILQDALSSIALDPSPYMDEAEKIVDAMPLCEDREATIKKAAADLAQKRSGKRFNRETLRPVYNAVDTFILSCVQPGKPEKKFSGDASQFFKMADNMKLFNAIVDITYLSGDDKKN